MKSFHTVATRLVISTAYLLLANSTLAAEPTWRDHFDRGLLQEELHQDLPKAIEHYQKNVDAFDAQRIVIAMSLYRLAECYRKLGQMDRAAPLYARITQEFADQKSLVIMSQRFVPSMEQTLSTPATPDLSSPASLLKILTQAPPEQVMVTMAQESNDSVAIDLLKRLNESESRMATLTTTFGDQHSEALKERANIESIQEQMARHAKYVLAYYQNRLNPNGPASTIDGTRATSIPPQLDDHPETLNALIEELEQMDPENALDLLITETDVRLSYNLVGDIESQRLTLLEHQNRYKPNHPRLVEAKRHWEIKKGALEAEIARAVEQLKIKLKILKQAPDIIAAPNGSAPPSNSQDEISKAERIMLETVRRMAVDGPDLLRLPNRNGRALIHEAVAGGFHQATAFLLEQGVDVNTADTKGRTPLHYASEIGNLQLVDRLLSEERIDVNSQSPYHSTPLHLAAESGYLAIVRTLVAAGADVDAATELKYEFPNDPNNPRNAFERRDYLAFRRGIPISNKVDHQADRAFQRIYPYFLSQGNTPLHLSAQKGYVGISQYLIDHGANVNATNRCGLTPLLHHLAHATLPLEAHTTIVKLLLENGANPNIKGSVTENLGVLGASAPVQSTYFKHRQKHAYELDIFPHFNSDIELETKAKSLPLGWTTPLNVAMPFGDELTQLLIDHGADINLQDQRGSTLFHLLLKHPNDRQLTTTLPATSPSNKGVPLDPLIRDIVGYRAVDYALMFGRHPGAIRQTIEQVPEIDESSFVRETFWTYLISGRVNPQSMAVLSELIQRNPDVVNEAGPTEMLPLDYALHRRLSPELGRWLLDNGAHPWLTDKIKSLKQKIELGDSDYKSVEESMKAIFKELRPKRAETDQPTTPGTP